MHQLSHQPRQDKNESAIRACKNTQPSQTIVHAKLEMTNPGDHDELEADAMADTVVNGGTIRREISNGSSGGGVAVSAAMESQLAQAKGGGRTMPDGLRNMMESGFGRDFSNVRIHTDSQAEAMNNSLSAKAFTLGNDIYFNKGQFSPNTREGQHLMAHELTHVVQGSGKVGRDCVVSGTDVERKIVETDYETTKKVLHTILSKLQEIKENGYKKSDLQLFKKRFGDIRYDDFLLISNNYLHIYRKMLNEQYYFDFVDYDGTTMKERDIAFVEPILSVEEQEESSVKMHTVKIIRQDKDYAYLNTKDAIDRVRIIIHELAHRVLNANNANRLQIGEGMLNRNEEHYGDKALCNERNLGSNCFEVAVNNADSYALFAVELYRIIR